MLKIAEVIARLALMVAMLTLRMVAPFAAIAAALAPAAVLWVRGTHSPLILIGVTVAWVAVVAIATWVLIKRLASTT